jgi:hypothetical protein
LLPLRSGTLRRLLSFLFFSLPLALAAGYGHLASQPALDIGPGDADYVQGLADVWRFDGQRTWREMRRRARLRLPVEVRGPGVLTLTLAVPSPARLRVSFNDGTVREITLLRSRGFREILLELPDRWLAADLRLRSEAVDGGDAPLRIDRVRWSAEAVRPTTALALQSLVLLIAAFAAFRLAGLSAAGSLAATLLLGSFLPPLAALVGVDGFSRIHLIRHGAIVATVGLAGVALARKWGGSGPALRALFFTALMLKSYLLFHPRFFFVDLPIHRTLMDLIYHRGLVDFWWRLPDYQVTHNLGVAPVDGVNHAFPYPVLFHAVASLGNRLVPDPDLWIKLTAALAAALSVFPVAALARRLSPARRADVFAGVTYLLIPATSRSLFLLELSAVSGHLLDLAAVAYLARASLSLGTRARFLAAAGALLASFVAYTSGFIHLGLLVGATLLLAPIAGGMTGADALRLAGAALGALLTALMLYHPETVANVFALLSSAGVELPSPMRLDANGLGASAVSRAVSFLGVPLLLLGPMGLVLSARRAPPSLRLLLLAWLVSALGALGLRFAWPDLFRYQKEMYWLGALLAVAQGILLARAWSAGRLGRVLALSALLATALAFGFALAVQLPQFYSRYIFF